MHKAGVAARVEGVPHCDWVLIDASDVIVHVFRPEVRAFYNLEKMWQGAGRRGARAERKTSRDLRDSDLAWITAARRFMSARRMPRPNPNAMCLDRRRRPSETRTRARARARGIANARRRPAARWVCATSKSSKFAKAAPTKPNAGASRNRSRSPMSFPRVRLSWSSTSAARISTAQRSRLCCANGARKTAPRCVSSSAAPTGWRRDCVDRAKLAAGLRRRDLAASNGSHHAVGAALSRRHDPRRPPLPSGLKSAPGEPCAFLILPHRYVTKAAALGLNPVVSGLALRIAFRNLASTLGHHDSPTVEPS